MKEVWIMMVFIGALQILPRCISRGCISFHGNTDAMAWAICVTLFLFFRIIVRCAVFDSGLVQVYDGASARKDAVRKPPKPAEGLV